MNSMENTGVVSNSLISMDFDFDAQSPDILVESVQEPSLFSMDSSGGGSAEQYTSSGLLFRNCGIKFNADSWTEGTYTDRHIMLDNIIRDFNSTANNEQKKIMLADAIFLLFINNIISFANLRACGGNHSLRIVDCLYKLTNKWLTDRREERDINLFIIRNLGLLNNNNA